MVIILILELHSASCALLASTALMEQITRIQLTAMLESTVCQETWSAITANKV